MNTKLFNIFIILFDDNSSDYTVYLVAETKITSSEFENSWELLFFQT